MVERLVFELKYKLNSWNLVCVLFFHRINFKVGKFSLTYFFLLFLWYFILQCKLLGL